jgi:hypothetical protein
VEGGEWKVVHPYALENAVRIRVGECVVPVNSSVVRIRKGECQWDSSVVRI